MPFPLPILSNRAGTMNSLANYFYVSGCEKKARNGKAMEDFNRMFVDDPHSAFHV